MFTPTTHNTIKYTYSFNAETAKAQSNMNSKLLATVHGGTEMFEVGKGESK